MAVTFVDAAFQLLITSTTVPKNRRPKFELKLKILDLNNVPLVTGTSYIKWHLPSSTSAEHRGRTPKAIIKEHKVNWDYEKTIPVRLTVGKGGMLQDFEINFEVLQEYASGARGEKILLGNVKLNLAEYVEASDDSEDGFTRRYLMQDSKINSTLKVSICMRQIDGDKNFTAPPLKTAPVFGGIAGIMTSEQGDLDDLGHMPSVSSKTREIGELQDMYRRALAASWASQVGELPADECVENIFAGGDGWGKHGSDATPRNLPSGKSTEDSTGDAESGGETRPTAMHHRRKSSGYGKYSNGKLRSHLRMTSKTSGSNGTEENRQGRGNHSQYVASSPTEPKRRSHGKTHEVDEFEVREDLRSWEISPKP